MKIKQLTDEALVVTLHAMTEKGIITARGDHFVIEETIAKMILCMAEPEWIFCLRAPEPEVPSYYCYKKEEVCLVSELFPGKKEVLRLSLYEEGIFKQLLTAFEKEGYAIITDKSEVIW